MPHRPPSSRVHTRDRRDLVIVLVAVVLTAIAFSTSITNGFTNWDDDVYLYENPYVTHPSWENARAFFTGFHRYHYHPLTMLGFMLEYAAWEKWAPGYHLVNFLFHLANTALVFLVLRRLRAGPIAAGIAAVLFGVHPIHVESVAWITERKDVLSTFFLLLSALAYFRSVEPRKGADSGGAVEPGDSVEPMRWGAYIGSVVLYAVSLLAKALGMGWAALLFLAEWGRGDRMRWPRWVNKLPFLALGIVAAGLTLVAQRTAIYADETARVIDNIALSARSFWFYLSKLAWPSGLCAIYPYPDEVNPLSPGYLAAMIGFVLFVALTIGSIRYDRARGRPPVWAAAWGFFLLSWIPFSGLVVYGIHFAADRYMYLPSIGPFVLVGIAVERIELRSRPWRVAWLRPALFLAGAMAIGALVGATAARCRVWRSGETLFGDVVARYPRCYFAWNNIGVYYATHGRYAEAIPVYERVISIAPEEALVWANLGVALQAEGKLGEALVANHRAVELDPRDAMAWNNIGSVHMQREEWSEALNAFAEAALLDPGYGLPRDNIRTINRILQSDASADAPPGDSPSAEAPTPAVDSGPESQQ